MRLTGRVLPALDSHMLLDQREPRCWLHFRLDLDVELRTPLAFERLVRSPGNKPPTITVVGRLSEEFVAYAIESIE
jgi:hypothetical protein